MLVDAVGCPTCERWVDERELRMEYLLSESCPRCGTVVHTSTGMRMNSVGRAVMADVMAIDQWLASYESANGARVTRCRDEEDAFKWSVESAEWGQCEMTYSSDHLGVVEVRIASTEDAERIYHEFDRAQRACGKYGVEVWRGKQVEMNTDTVEYEWRVVRILSTGNLCHELFDPVLDVLRVAMKAVIEDFSRD